VVAGGNVVKKKGKTALDLSAKKKGVVGAEGMPGMAGPPPGMMMPGAPAMGPGGYGPAVPGMRGRTSVSETRVTKLTDEERKKQKTLWVWVHDLTAKPGKTYKYQMKVFMYNPLAGYKKILKTPENNLVVGLASPWSSASEPVKVVSEYYIFLSTIGDGNKTANLLVYKWHNGWLYKENFEVKPGQTIGAKKKVKIYRKVAEGLIQEPTQDLDFNTGAVLQNVQGTEVALKMSDGTIIKQDTSNINSDKDLKKCKSTITSQLQTIKTGPVIKAEQSAKEASE
jgi:hypothetical protein